MQVLLRTMFEKIVDFLGRGASVMGWGENKFWFLALENLTYQILTINCFLKSSWRVLADLLFLRLIRLS